MAVEEEAPSGAKLVAENYTGDDLNFLELYGETFGLPEDNDSVYKEEDTVIVEEEGFRAEYDGSEDRLEIHFTSDADVDYREKIASDLYEGWTAEEEWDVIDDAAKVAKVFHGFTRRGSPHLENENYESKQELARAVLLAEEWGRKYNRPLVQERASVVTDEAGIDQDRDRLEGGEDDLATDLDEITEALTTINEWTRQQPDMRSTEEEIRKALEHFNDREEAV